MPKGKKLHSRTRASGKVGYRDVETIIDTLKRTGGIVAPAAQALGCSKKSLYSWIHGSPVIQEALVEIADDVLDLAESQLIKAINEGSEKSTHFYLSTKGRSRGYTKRQEIAGVPDQPLVVRPDLSGMTMAELERWERVLAAKAAGEIGEES